MNKQNKVTAKTNEELASMVAYKHYMSKDNFVYDYSKKVDERLSGPNPFTSKKQEDWFANQ